MDGDSRQNGSDYERTIRSKEKEGVRPEFLGGGETSNSDPAGSDAKKERAETARGDLQAAESNATGGEAGGDRFDQAGEDSERNSLNEARTNEEDAGGFYTGSGKAREDDDTRRGKKKGKFRKFGPTIMGIFLSVLGFGTVSFTGVSMELVAWKENISSVFGQNSAVINTRSNTIMRKLLSTNKSTTTNFGTEYKISTKLSQKLKEQNINYVETSDANGESLKMLVFEDADGRIVPVVASDSDVPRANSIAGTEIDIGGGEKVKLADASLTLAEAKTNDVFLKEYDTATATFTGRIAGWFDSMADAMYARIVGDGARNQTTIKDPTKEEMDEVLLSNKSQGVDDGEMSTTKDYEDDDGEIKTHSTEASDTVDADSGMTYGDVESESSKLSVSDSDAEATKKSASESLRATAMKVAMIASSVGCAFLKGVGAISTTVGAIQVVNVINYASKYLELADRIKAGDADESVNLALDNLNTSVTTKTYDIDGNEVETTGTVTASTGWNAIFSSRNIINENDSSALMVNREYANKNALRSVGLGNLSATVLSSIASFGGGVAAFKICNGLQMTMSAIDFISDIGLFLTTAGIGNAVKEFVKGAVKGISLSIAMGAIALVISAVAPIAGQWLGSKLSSVFLGDVGGYALDSGAKNILDANLQMSTGRYADKENAVEVFALTQDVETEWAAYDRATRSPFDATSKYTFLGSLVNSALPIINQTGGSFLALTSSVIELAGDSALAVVSPTVSAASSLNDFAGSLASNDNCSYLHSVGVAGDYACNKYSGAYVSNLYTDDPEAVHKKMERYDSFSGEDASGNPKIKDGSEYAKFLVACVSSDTQPGTMSAAVEGYIQQHTTTGNTTADALISFGMNFVPFSGLLDMIDGAEQEKNSKWNSGLACTGNTGDAEFDEMIKTFSMYNLDQRVLNAMDVIDTNSTVSFLEEYYEENPLDKSFEGEIARVSGMTKEQVSDTLALLEYYEFVANYDSSERYAFGGSAVERSETLRFDSENVLAGDVVLPLQSVYADVRNRNFAV